MMRMKNRFIQVLLFSLLLVGVYFTSWRFRDRLLQWQYDWTHENEPVYSHEEIDDIFDQLRTLPYSKLSKEYLSYTKSHETAYRELIQELSFIRLSREDLNKRIVGDYRIKDFLCKDDFYQDCVLKRRDDVFCLLNKKIFHKTH